MGAPFTDHYSGVNKNTSQIGQHLRGLFLYRWEGRYGLWAASKAVQIGEYVYVAVRQL